MKILCYTINRLSVIIQKINRKGDIILLLQAQQVARHFGADILFENVNLDIKDNSKIALVGRNGAGKSTLIKMLIGESLPDEGKIVTKRDLTIGYLAQHTGLESTKNVLDEMLSVFEPLQKMEAKIHQLEEKIASPSIPHESKEYQQLLNQYDQLQHDFQENNGYGYENEVKAVLHGFQFFEDDYGKMVSDLSGGQKTRLALAKLLLEKRDLLILDEPTNHLDIETLTWLENYIQGYTGALLIVSHDRYFLNKVCTNIADMDYGKIQLYAGNYDFWYESSQLLVRQMKEANKKKEEKIKELQEFISRFSANASKSKQATSRKRALEKIQLDDIRPSSRKYPYIDFRPNREIGNEVLTVDGISKTIDGVKVLDNISFIVGHDDKIAFVGGNELAKTTLFKILAGEMEPDEGSYKWGVTTSQSYFPKDNTAIFDSDELIVDWLTQYSEIKDATYVRGFLGRMLFAGEDGVKKMRVLSGGEKVRVLLSRMMIMGSNVLIFDEPTDHLDMESITALNNGMIKFPGVILFACRDHQVVQTTANRIIEFLPDGSMVDKVSTYDEYLESDVMARKRQVYNTTADEEADD